MAMVYPKSSSSLCATLLAGVAAIGLLAGCSVERRPDSTANNRILKAKCVRGLDLDKLNENRVSKLNADPYAVVRTYLYKDDQEGFSAAVPRYKEQPVQLAASEGNLINVEKDCQNLMARVQLPGHELMEAEIQNIDLNTIDLKVGTTQIHIEQTVDKTSKEDVARNERGFNRVSASVKRLSVQHPGHFSEYIIRNDSVELSRPTDEIIVDASAIAGASNVMGASAENSGFMSKMNGRTSGQVSVTVEDMAQVQTAVSQDPKTQTVERAVIPRDIPAVDAGVDEAPAVDTGVDAGVATDDGSTADDAAVTADNANDDAAATVTPAPAAAPSADAGSATVEEIVVTGNRNVCAKDDDACWKRLEIAQAQRYVDEDCAPTNDHPQAAQMCAESQAKLKALQN